MLEIKLCVINVLKKLCKIMMQLVECKECGGTEIGLDSVCVNIVLSKSEWCEHCRETKTIKQDHFFCSQSCYENFGIVKWKEN